MGLQNEELLTPVARESWLSCLENDLHISDTTQLQNIQNLWQWVEITTDPEHAHGTTNFIALDHNGSMAAGVSTSGWAWKYPGRIGDSPIIGAGLYADDRYGAVTCTGTGEMAIRACTAHSVVFYLKTGMSLEEAGKSAMRDLNDLGGDYISGMNLIAMTPEGHHCGYSSREDTYYSYLSESMKMPAEVKRHFIPIKQRWQKRSNPVSP
jgi:beta-aspartyl-peptidase (threonine type)